MTMEQVFKVLKDGLREVIKQNNLTESQISITSKALSPEEAIGITQRKDFPILTGKEIMLQASFREGGGQAFTDSPAVFCGSLEEILGMDLINDIHARGLFIAALNAVMKYAGLIENTIHCKNKEPELCAQKFVSYIRDNYEKPKIALIGFQPALLEHLSEVFELRVLDLNPDNIGKIKYGKVIEDGLKDFEEVVVKWADLIFCTGSTICNGSIVNFINLEKEVLFFGTTLAGAAQMLKLKRACFYSS
ncbi:MAG: DUF364 domain-containing protein [Anaerocolumna sp.]